MMRVLVLIIAFAWCCSLGAQPWTIFYPTVSTKIIMDNTPALALARSGFLLTDVPGFPVTEGFLLSERLSQRFSISTSFVRTQTGPLVLRQLDATIGFRLSGANQYTIGLVTGFGLHQVRLDWNTMDRMHTNENVPSSVSIHPQGQAVLSCFLKSTLLVFSVEQLIQEPFAFPSANHRVYLLKQIPFFELRCNQKMYHNSFFKAELGWCASGYKGLPLQTAMSVVFHFGSDFSFYLNYGYRSFFESGIRLSLQKRIDFLYAWRYFYNRSFAVNGHQIGCVFYLHGKTNTSPLPITATLNPVNEAYELQWNRLQTLLDSIQQKNQTVKNRDTLVIKQVIFDTVWAFSRNSLEVPSSVRVLDDLTKVPDTATIEKKVTDLKSYYAIVMGVYQNHLQAERFRYRLQEALLKEVEIIQLKNQEVYYVIINKEESLTALWPNYYSILKITQKKKLTNGQPWIYILK